MNCTEFQNALPDFMDGGAAPEAEGHLKSCAACAGLVTDLREIAGQARLLAASDEPGPHVWERIAESVESEVMARPEAAPRRAMWWGAGQSRWAVPAWAATVAALLLLSFQLNTLRQAPAAPAAVAVVKPAALVDNDDLKLLEAVGKRHPNKRARYRAHIEAVNASIRDAKRSVEEDPANELARERLIQAYDQKSALYEMAMAQSMK